MLPRGSISGETLSGKMLHTEHAKRVDPCDSEALWDGVENKQSVQGFAA
jgi:hypothetical protein